MADLTKLESYIDIPHRLDDCYNDGTMWRADVNPSALTGSFVECLIPFDDKNYQEGDLIPDYYKWAYDRYIESEPDLKGYIAAILFHEAIARGLEVEASKEATPDEILGRFRLSQIYLSEPDEYQQGQVELSFHLLETRGDSFEVIVSVAP